MARIIITGNTHISIHNLPRYSRHTLIHPKAFPAGRYPLGKIWHPLHSLAAWQPVWQGYDIIHAFNTIPYTNKPFFITFEEFLFWNKYRPKGVELILKEALQRSLLKDNCRQIIAMSDYAKHRLTQQLAGWENLHKLLDKVQIIHPNFPVQASQPKAYREAPIKLLFVGNHIARKGGIVALRLAKKALDCHLPLEIHIVSQLKCGASIPTDFPDSNQYAEDLKLLDLPNVVFHHQLSNQQVLELLSQSHFQIMATLHDTYGFSILEGFSLATPAITTNVCALPEFVKHETNGYHLNLPINEKRVWGDWCNADQRDSHQYWQTLDRTYNNLAEQALQICTSFLDRHDKTHHYQHLSTNALSQAQTIHNSTRLNDYFDHLYEQTSMT